MKKHSIILAFAIVIVLSLYSVGIISAQATCTWSVCTNVSSVAKSSLSTDVKNFLLKLASLRSKQKASNQKASSNSTGASTSQKAAADKLAAQKAAAQAAVNTTTRQS